MKLHDGTSVRQCQHCSRWLYWEDAKFEEPEGRILCIRCYRQRYGHDVVEGDEYDIQSDS